MHGPPSARRAFTVVELLVVIGIVIGIISTLLVGLNIASRRARGANTEFLMNSIVTALTRFRSEVGYFPVALGDPGQLAGDAVVPAQPPARGWCRAGLNAGAPAVGVDAAGEAVYDGWSTADRARIQRSASSTSLPEFLVGPGDRSEDGYGIILDNGAFPPAGSPGYREQPAVGIRDPGRDGLWGAWTAPRAGQNANGSFLSRNLAAATVQGNNEKTNPLLKGKSLGPYLELKNASDLGALRSIRADGTHEVVLEGEDPNFNALPKVFLDAFGGPIMYYRRGYVNLDPKQPNPNWSLADVVALRPDRFGPGEDMNAMPDGRGDPSASRAARSAEFGLVSLGPDKRWNVDVRVDPAGANEDNIRRLGP
jgi:type II secretory pathway pseudopilin PulG